MAIEQRIGRIDRIGQQREVFVFNLVTRGTLEDRCCISGREDLHVRARGRRSGGDPGRDSTRIAISADLMLDAWLEATEASRAEAFDALGRRLPEARQHHESAKALDDELFGEDFETA